MLSIAQIPPRTVRRRRLIAFALCSAIFLAGFAPMADVLATGGLNVLEILILCLFAILFSLVAFGVTLSILGFWTLWRGGDPLRITQTAPADSDVSPLPSTAVVIPIFNEDVPRVFHAIRAMAESLARTGRGESFDFFVLSDSTDPNHWLEEERTWLELCRDLNAFGRVFYRKRRLQLHHKSGNIADFCRRWGANYRYMVVLDADSVMTGPALVRLVELMERNRSVGIIQTAPQMVLGNTLFRRIQQFAARLYGPVFMAGAHFWHLGGGNYWGHNAIIRLKLFMAHCALPELPKLGRIGGRILSHDTIEAAFMRRAGYGVWFAYDLDGSYEEGPPELLASLQRDRRWCQGNMQHLLILFRRGLRLSSRIHILLGIMAYASAPLWFLSIVVTTIAAIIGWRESVPHTYAHLWQEPAFKSVLLFAYVMTLLLLPKFLGVVSWTWHRSGLAPFGGAVRVGLSVLSEVVFSTLLAPILMVFYTKFVLAALTGATIKWGKQKRGEERPTWAELWALLGGQTLLAIGAWAVLGWVAPQVIPWLIPVLAGLTFAVPFARFTASRPLGEQARAHGWFLIPEETAPPIELAGLNQAVSARQSPFFDQPAYAQHLGLLEAVLDPYLHAIHVSLLRLREPAPDKARIYTEELRTRLLAAGPDSLSPEERNNLLWDPEALITLHRELWAASASQLHPWWQQALRHYNESTEIATRRQVNAQPESESAIESSHPIAAAA